MRASVCGRENRVCEEENPHTGRRESQDLEASKVVTPSRGHGRRRRNSHNRESDRRLVKGRAQARESEAKGFGKAESYGKAKRGCECD